MSDKWAFLLAPMNIWVLDPEWHEGPQWRRASLSLVRAASQKVYLELKLRQSKSGAKAHALYSSCGFRASLDRLLEDILRETFDEAALRTLCIEPQDRFTGIVRLNRGSYGDRGNGTSPSMGFEVSPEAAQLLKNMNQHQKLSLHQAAATVAEREARRKSRTRVAA